MKAVTVFVKVQVSVIKNKEIYLAVGTVITYKFNGTTKKSRPTKISILYVYISSFENLKAKLKTAGTGG